MVGRAGNVLIGVVSGVVAAVLAAVLQFFLFSMHVITLGQQGPSIGSGIFYAAIMGAIVGAVIGYLLSGKAKAPTPPPN